MIERFGFDERAALAMRSACGMDDDDTFVERARHTEFWGLYNPDPVGGVLIEMEGKRPVLHAGCLTRGHAGHAIKRIVKTALAKHGRLYAAMQVHSISAIRLTRGLGFTCLFTSGDWVIYGKEA